MVVVVVVVRLVVVQVVVKVSPAPIRVIFQGDDY